MKSRLSFTALLWVLILLPLSFHPAPSDVSPSIAQTGTTGVLASSAPSSSVAGGTPTMTSPVNVPIAQASEKDVPVRLLIPSIGLNDPIQPLGVNAKGEMDVPNGKTNNVGWYEYGTVPGKTGSAVLDAHVFAAFANLKSVQPGADIYVMLQSGAKLHFKVLSATTYALADVPLQALFNQNDAQYLNLITCAGKLTADRTTYDHRLIVHAELATH